MLLVVASLRMIRASLSDIEMAQSEVSMYSRIKLNYGRSQMDTEDMYRLFTLMQTTCSLEAKMVPLECGQEARDSFSFNLMVSKNSFITYKF